MTKDEFVQFVEDRFSTGIEYPWEDNGYVFRHQSNRKWFVVGMRVPYRTVGLERDGLVDVVDVKCGPLLMGSYRGLPGLLPGYHMNKNHWITILLDGSAEDSLIRELTEISYDLTNTKPRVRSEK